MNIDQRHYDKEPASKAEKVTLYILVTAFLGMMSMEVLTNYEARKLGILFFLLFWMPLVFIHEFGHAIMAKMLGWQVKQTVIGFGKVLFSGRMLGAPLEMRMFPLEGFVQIAPLSTYWARAKHALIYFAGPGIELLLFAIIVLWMGWDNFFTVEDDYWKIALQALAFAALVGAVLNLIPMGVVTKDGHSPNDGMGIIMCLFHSDKDYQQWIDENNRQLKQEGRR